MCGLRLLLTVTPASPLLFGNVRFPFGKKTPRKVRDCCLSTLRAMRALLPVLLLELLVTLVYSCVCVALYHGVEDAQFTTLGDAFLSLFTLSTTVNDPDVWLPLYYRRGEPYRVTCVLHVATCRAV